MQMKRRFKYGEDFDISNVKVEKAIQLKDDTCRPLLVMTFIPVGVLFLAGAAAMGIYEGNFDKLEAVWVVLAAPFGAVMHYYFGNQKKTSEVS